MYHADTPTHTIHAFDYDVATGTPSRRRVFAQWSGETDRPDGGAVDSAGNYWTAFYRGGKVRQALAARRRARGVRDSRDVPDDVRVRRTRPHDALRDHRAPDARARRARAAAAVGRHLRDAGRRARPARAAFAAASRAPASARSRHAICASRSRSSLGATSSGASFATSTGDILEVSAYGPGVFRLRFGPRTRPDYGIVVGRAKRLHACAVRRATRGASRRATRRSRSPAAPLRMSLSGRKRRCWSRSPTSTSAAGPGCRRSAACRRAGCGRRRSRCAVGESVYGLGEKFGPLDKRGQLIHSQVEDALGVNTGLSYKNTPFAWSPGSGKGAWGVFVHTPGHGDARRRPSGLVASQLRHAGRGRSARPVPVRRGHAGGDPRALHRRHRQGAGRPALEPRPVGFARVLQDAGGGRRGRGTSCARVAFRATCLRSTAARRGRPRRASISISTPSALPIRRRRSRGSRRTIFASASGSIRTSRSIRRCSPISRERRFLLKDVTGAPYVFDWDANPGDEPFGKVLTPLPTFGHPRLHQSRRVCVVARRAQEALRRRRRRDQERLRRAGARRRDRRERRQRTAAAQRLSAALQPLRVRGDRALPAQGGRAADGVEPRRRGPAASATPMGWGGDPQSDWEGLAASIRGGLSWGMSGNPYHSSRHRRLLRRGAAVARSCSSAGCRRRCSARTFASTASASASRGRSAPRPRRSRRSGSRSATG